MKRDAYLWTVGLALVATLGGGTPSEAKGAVPGAAEPTGIAESLATRTRVNQLRTRFLLPTPLRLDASPRTPRAMKVPTGPRPMLGASQASGFSRREGSVRAMFPAEAQRRVSRTASVVLPVHAGAPVRLEDDTTHVEVRFALRGASDAVVTTSGGVAMYAGALGGADVLHRVHPEGTEDYVAFEQRPRQEQLTYDVELSRVAGLRLVSNTLEFLDEGGAPRLRVAPPFVVDANGVRSEGVLGLEGCAFDVNPRAPWGRRVTSPGASRCAVSVAWSAAAYPAMVDPSWAATGSMATAREDHTATTLGPGIVLIVGGSTPPALSSAELYDSTSGAFAATGSLNVARFSHTATPLGSGKVLVAGGQGLAPTYGSYFLSSAELYDPTAGTFTPTGSMNASRLLHSATWLDTDEVLVAGGFSDDGALGGVVSSAEIYQPTLGSFGVTGSMTMPRDGQTATLLGSGRVLLAGGSGSANAGTTAELFDPATTTFSATGKLTTHRELHAATLVGTGKAAKVLIVGGYSGAPVSTAELYDPKAGTFAATGSMITPRDSCTLTLLGSGTGVLVAGGEGLASAELYNPAAGTFGATASMGHARSSHTATLLGFSQLLVTGGSDGSSSLSSAELFNCDVACPVGANCGSVLDGCGGTVPCGPACASPETCGGGGTPNVCGCTPMTACPTGDDCGRVSDGCGAMLTCGACGKGQTCVGNVCTSADSGAGSIDSGPVGKDSGPGGDASGGGPGDGGGCSCRTAQGKDVPPYVLLGFGVFVMAAVRRARRTANATGHGRPSTWRCLHRPRRASRLLGSLG